MKTFRNLLVATFVVSIFAMIVTYAIGKTSTETNVIFATIFLLLFVLDLVASKSNKKENE